MTTNNYEYCRFNVSFGNQAHYWEFIWFQYTCLIFPDLRKTLSRISNKRLPTATSIASHSSTQFGILVIHISKWRYVTQFAGGKRKAYRQACDQRAVLSYSGALHVAHQIIVKPISDARLSIKYIQYFRLLLFNILPPSAIIFLLLQALHHRGRPRWCGLVIEILRNSGNNPLKFDPKNCKICFLLWKSA